jgi:hypothetical protein
MWSTVGKDKEEETRRLVAPFLFNWAKQAQTSPIT